MSDNYHELLGMKCADCGIEIGSLVLPEGITPASLGIGFTSMKIYPICKNCIKRNPRHISYENVRELE